MRYFQNKALSSPCSFENELLMQVLMLLLTLTSKSIYNVTRSASNLSV